MTSKRLVKYAVNKLLEGKWNKYNLLIKDKKERNSSIRGWRNGKTRKIIVDKNESRLNCKYTQCQWNKFSNQKTKVTRQHFRITIPNYIIIEETYLEYEDKEKLKVERMDREILYKS